MALSTFEGYIEVITPSAVRFRGHYWEGALWFPRSQTFIEPDNDETGSVILRVKDWLANKRGLLEFTAYNAAEIEAMNAQ